MELNEQHGFLEELLALRRDMTWESSAFNNPTPQMSELFSNEFGFDFNFFDQIQIPSSSTNNVGPNSLFHDHQTSFLNNLHSLDPNNIEPYNSCPFTSSDFSLVLPNEFNNSDSSHNTSTNTTTSNFHVQDDQNHHLYPLLCSNMEEEELGILGDEIHNLETQLACKIEPMTTTQSSISSPENIPSFNIGSFERNKSNININNNGKPKKLLGQPSKNLMAERRRRKRLNDRLSMLRSIVPKISKMDRTSILGDTIEYMKELLERIDNLRKEIETGSGQSTAEIGLFKEVKPNEVLVRNSPKFDVDRRNVDTRIEICCAGKPGLLYSTVTTLEALGLEIQQCVISCFNDFAMQASCTEELEKKAVIGPEEVKQALFRNAGYGGRCL